MTAHDLIKAAFRINGALDTGETPSASMSQDGLEALQIILDFWSGQGLMIYAQTSETLSLTTAVSYTIGTGGDFSTARPDQIAGATVSSGGLDYPLTIIDAAKYREISQKTNSGTPCWLFYSPEYPLGKIYVYPAPLSGDTLNLDSLKPLTEPTDLTTAISLPPGYERCIKYQLAVDLAPEHGRMVDPLVYKIAEDCVSSLMSKNAASRAQTARLDLEKLSRNYVPRYDIDGG